MTPIRATPEAAPVEVGPEPTPAEPKAPIRFKYDVNGRALPLTEAEHAAHRAALRAALVRMAELPVDDDCVPDEEIFRAIDSHRPHRPLFEGLY